MKRVAICTGYKIKFGQLIIILSLVIFTFSGITNFTILAGIFLMTLLAFYINIKFLNKKGIFIPKLLLCLLLFQNTAIGLGAHLGNNDSNALSLLTQIPTIFIVISFAYVLLSNPLRKMDLIFILYALICFMQMFQSSGEMTAKLSYLRNFLVFYMGYRVGGYYITTKENLTEFLSFYVKMAVFSGIFGLIGMVLGRNFYQAIGTLEVYHAKKYTSYVNGLPGNFRTLFWGKWMNRLASFYYDPVNFSYFMALGALIAFAGKNKIFIFLFICEILTFGKGGLLIVVLSVFCIVTHRILKRYNGKFVKGLMIGVSIGSVIVLVLLIQTYFADDFGTANHFYGIITGVDGIRKNPFGYGIGSAGNLLKTTDMTIRRRMDVAETGLINMVYQIGVLPALLFAWLLLSTSKVTLRNYESTRNDIYLLFTYIPLILLIISIFQENTFTPQCIIPYMMIQGATGNRSVMPDKNEYESIPTGLRTK